MLHHWWSTKKDFVSSELIQVELLLEVECIASIILFGERSDSTNRSGTKAVLVRRAESISIQDGFFYRWSPTRFSTSCNRTKFRRRVEDPQCLPFELWLWTLYIYKIYTTSVKIYCTFDIRPSLQIDKGMGRFSIGHHKQTTLRCKYILRLEFMNTY